MISEILRDIPWLPIDIDIDIVKLQQEYKFVCENYRFEDRQPHVGRSLRPGKNCHANAWSGISLISSDGSLYNDLKNGSTMDDNDNNISTELKNYCKYSFELINSFKKILRCRIMRVSPQSSLAWHSHVHNIRNEDGQSEETILIQIPIEMPENFEYCVVDKKEFTKDKWVVEERVAPPSSFKNIYRGKFDIGKAYYFNSYQYHNVYNYSDTYKVSIMLYCDLRDENVEQLIKKSLVKEGFLE